MKNQQLFADLPHKEVILTGTNYLKNYEWESDGVKTVSTINTNSHDFDTSDIIQV